MVNERFEIIGLGKVDKNWLDLRPNLKVIGCNCTGLDHVDFNECKKRGVKVFSLKDEKDFLSRIVSTAEHTIGLIFALLRNYKMALNPPYQNREAYKGHTLKGKKLGIIGYGRVGRQVADRLQWFEIEIFTFDKYDPLYTLRRLLEKSDLVSIHIPLEGNEGFFTKEMFSKMKPTACVINTSRDKVIQKGSLLWALQNKIIAGAAIDFIDDPELLEYSKMHNNLILTNHIGGVTVEDMVKTEEFIKNKVKIYLNENKIKNNN